MLQPIDDARRKVRPAPSGTARVPPHNLEAEESLLGAMLLSRDTIAIALERCSAADFYKPAHGHVFGAVTSLYAAGEPADAVTVADELHRAGLLDEVGGAAALVALQANTPAVSSAGRYAEIVQEHALLRRLIGVGGEIAELGFSLPDDVIGAVDRAETMVFEIAQRRTSDSIATLEQLLSKSLDRLEELYDRGESITGVPTGYHDLDELLAGLQRSNLVVVGARPSMGKTAFALGLAANAAVAGTPVLFFSLEMSHLEIAQRVLCAEARVDATRMRNGRLHEEDWGKISHAIGRLGSAPLHIDDNPNVTVMDIRAKARRMKSRDGLGLVVVDYLQLMTGRTTAENRQVEISEISRGLKLLARELEIPVVALSQLSRTLESRADKRPMLADLRECLTADTRIVRADTNEEVTIGELARSRARDVPVWSLGEDYRLVPSVMAEVWSTGTKPVFEVRLASGRRLRATANHPLLKLSGWTPVASLQPGDRIAVARTLPESERSAVWPESELVLLAHLIGDGCTLPSAPVHYTTADPDNGRAVETAARHFGVVARWDRVDAAKGSGHWQIFLPAPYPLTHGRRNPIAEWLDGLGLWGRRSWQKFVPNDVFRLSCQQVAFFLRHLWATDGCVSVRKSGDVGRLSLYYSTTSRRLAEDVQALLLRCGISSRLRKTTRSRYRQGYAVWIDGKEHQLAFLDKIGVHGRRGKLLDSLRVAVASTKSNPNVDAIPREVWQHIRSKSLPAAEVTTRQLAQILGMRYAGSTLYKSGISRERLGRMVGALGDPWLTSLASSDVFWDRVLEVVPAGEEEVFDAFVPGTQSFLANGIVSHNSGAIEQDSDVVMFIYRDEIYNQESSDRGTAEVLVAKHRNGPTGMVQLAFVANYARFANMARV